MLFEMTLLQFESSQLIGVGAFLGPFCLCLFIIIVVFICMSMFLSIINENFRRARQNAQDDPEVFSHMTRRFLRWTGLKKSTVLEMAEERDIQMRSEYLHTMETLPQRIDQLFDIIHRMYLHSVAERSRDQPTTV